MDNRLYDVFVSHHPQDKDAALRLYEDLKKRELRPWIAARDLVPGRPWQKQLEQVLLTTPAAAVLVGASGLGPWEDMTVGAALEQFVERRASVIPVLLPDAPADPGLPLFLRRFAWVDLREESVERIVVGIEAARRLVALDDGAAPAVQDDVLASWLRQVAADHRRLADHFDRPVELEDIERAWVRLELAMPDGEHRDVLSQRPQQATLDDFLALDPTEHEWITRRWLVEGDPGSGKTTLLRHLAGRLARADEPRHVPVFVSLPRVVEPARPLLEYLTNEIGTFCGPKLPEVLDQEGCEGRLLVFLDGLDEVPPERRDRVERLLARIEDDWPRSSLVLTSRPIGLGRPPHGFRKLLLQPLDDAQRRRFLDNWFGYRSMSDPAAEATSAARHFDSERSLRELSHNPLHLTLLTVLWEKGVKAPTRRSELYDGRAVRRLALLAPDVSRGPCGREAEGDPGGGRGGASRTGHSSCSGRRGARWDPSALHGSADMVERRQGRGRGSRDGAFPRLPRRRRGTLGRALRAARRPPRRPGRPCAFADRSQPSTGAEGAGDSPGAEA